MPLPHLTPILPLASESATLPLAGGKGANLARLAQAGLPVPDGFTITTQAYQAFVAANGLTERIPAVLSTGSLDNAGRSVRMPPHASATFSGKGSVPADLAAQILDAYAGLGRPAVAVRSSATAEDLPEMSFAGQQDTYLNVIGADALLQAVVACWSSLWTARAISYRERNGVAHADVALAVVVQQMVESEASGVLFTANPLTGLRSETVIDATVGLGEALVSGQVEPDHYVVDTSTGQIIGRTLGAKALSVRSRPGGGTVTVPEDPTAAPALPDAQILALAALGGRVAALYDAPAGHRVGLGRRHLLPAADPPDHVAVPRARGHDGRSVAGDALLRRGAGDARSDHAPGPEPDRAHHRRRGAALRHDRDGGDTDALFTAGERLWINLTPLLRNTVGRRIVPGITAGRPGQRRGAGRHLARSAAATHAARDQPQGSPTHRARRGSPRRPCAAQPALPRPAPALHRGARGAVAPRRGRALRRDPGRAPRPAGPVG